MAHLRDILQGQLDLRPELPLHLVDLPLVLHNRQPRIVGIRGHHREKITVTVHQARARGQRTPFDIVPLAGDRQMQSDIDPRILPQQASRLRKPGRHHHYLDRCFDSFLKRLHTGDICRPERPHVVGTDNQARHRLLRSRRPGRECQHAAACHFHYRMCTHDMLI